jgi:hypothetical protein
MKGSHASSGEMPGLPFPSRPGRNPDEPLLDMILDGQPLPAEAPRGMLTLAERLASLSRPAGPGEVPGEAVAMAAFSRAVAGASVSPAGGEPAHRKLARRYPPRWRAARPFQLAGGLLVVIGLGSAAAYADVLPGPVQDFAHHVIGAPAAHASPGRSGEHQKAAHGAATAHHPAGSRRGQHPGKPGTTHPNRRHHRLHPAQHGKAVKKGQTAQRTPPPHPTHPVQTPSPTGSAGHAPRA